VCTSGYGRGGERMTLLDVCGERGIASAWSITHFLHGWLWNTIWMFATQDYMPWLNLFVGASLELLFEVWENYVKSGVWSCWVWLGYTPESYDGDSAINSASDVLFALLGWGLARLVLVGTGLTGLGLGLTLGAAALLLVVFLILHWIERRVNRIGNNFREAQRPAVFVAP